MRLGVETGNVINYLQGNAVRGQPEPKVGMGVTFLHWTDRKAGTILEVLTIDGRRALRCQEDTAIRTDSNGMSDCQSYDYAPNPSGEVLTYRQARNGRWHSVKLNPATNRYRKENGGPGLRIGDRDSYHDHSF